MATIHILWPETGGNFSLIIHHENLEEFPEGKTHGSGKLHMSGYPWAFLVFFMSSLSFQQFINYSLGFSTMLLVPKEVSAYGVLLE